MSDYLQLKTGIEKRADTLDGIISDLVRPGIVEESRARKWRGLLDQVRTSFEDSVLRVAVVGAVKSGKSTLINSLLGKDVLKRGAGIITAFITRVRSAESAGGWVELKPWSRILEELNATLGMMPAVHDRVSMDAPLDLRRDEDRSKLSAVLQAARGELQEARGELDPQLILLAGYLSGYDRLHESLGEDPHRLTFDESTLAEHQKYVGREDQAIYVRDMALHYPVPWLGEKVELGDCQGSDSPNPLHYALLQEYLLRSHLILYVISSRTGLREADFKLLEFIRSLRMFPQTFFILNADLDIHPDEEDLRLSLDRARSELSWMVPDPEIHAFSALYHLLAQLQGGLNVREKRRLDLWQGEEGLAGYTEEGFCTFRDQLARRISAQRMRVLVGSGLNRLAMVAGSVLDAAEIQKRFMAEDMQTLRQSAKELEVKQEVLQTTLATLENAVSGLRDTLKRELAESVEHFFDLTESPLVREALETADRHAANPRGLKDLSDPAQVVGQLHRFYLDFRQSLYRYLVEKVSLRLIEFARERELFIQDRLNRSSRAFWSLYEAALEDYRQKLARFGVEMHVFPETHDPRGSGAREIALPSFSRFLDTGATGRGILLLKFGLGRLSRFLVDLKLRIGTRKDLFRTPHRESESVREAVALIKAETQTELMHAFRDYRDELLRSYLYEILDEETRRILEELRVRTELAEANFEGLMDQGRLAGEKRGEVAAVLDRSLEGARGMLEEIEEVRSAVSLE